MRKFQIVFLIFIIAFSIRVWRISSLPSSLSIDEVTYGYAGYSILHTAHDEFGKLLPLAFQGVGDYKPPVNVYLNAFSILLFGLNEFAVRIPDVLLGSLTCIVLIFLLEEFGLSRKSALFGGFWLAVSGWHIFFSRAGYDSVTALFFLTLATYLFLLGIRQKKKIALYFSLIFYSLSFWSYHAERIFIPILFLLLVTHFRNNLRIIFKKRGSFILPLLIAGIFILPFLSLLFFSKGASARGINLWIGNAPHNGNIVEAFVGQYLSYFDLKFLFWDGLGLTPKNFQGMGIFSLIDIPLVITGIYELIKSNNKKIKYLLLIWLFLSPLPGAFARGDPSPVRVLVAAPFFAGLVGLGFEKLYSKYKKVFLIISLSFSLLSLVYFFNLYIYAFPKYNADIWNYGYKEVAQYVCNNYHKYDKVIITDKYGIELPNIKTVPNYYILFHCNINPVRYLLDKNLMNIEIRQPQWRIDSKLKNTLLIGSRWDFPENFDMSKIFKIVYFPSGKPAFYFVETNLK